MSGISWFIRYSAIVPRAVFIGVKRPLDVTVACRQFAISHNCYFRLGTRMMVNLPHVSLSGTLSAARNYHAYCACCSRTSLVNFSDDTPVSRVYQPSSLPRLLGDVLPNKTLFQKRELSTESTITAPVQFGGLYKFFSELAPVLKTQELLVYFHDTSGLPWWATIIISTVALRMTVTFPLAIYQYYILAKVENLTLEMSRIVEELKKETVYAIKVFNWTQKEARITYNRSLKKQWNKLVIRDNCHPAKASILLFVQLPMWIFLSFALRNLVYMLPHQDAAAQITCLELSVSNFLWVPNLIAPDASWILPVTLGLTNLAVIEMQSLTKLKEPGKIQKLVTNFFRLVSIGMVPVAATVPACLSLYWVTSSTFGLIQNILLLSPRVKRMCGIPRTPSTVDKPYQQMAERLKSRTNRLFNWRRNKG